MENIKYFFYGEQGLLDTLEPLEQTGVAHSGINRSPEEQEDISIIQRSGIRMAMLSYTCDMNRNHYGKKHLIHEVHFSNEGLDLSLAERHVDSRGKKHLLFYSLGDFVSYHFRRGGADKRGRQLSAGAYDP